MLEIAADLETAATANRARADEFAPHQSFILGDVRNDFLVGEQHAFADTRATGLAVDARFHLQLVRVADFIRRHDPGAEHVTAVKALALGGAEPSFHLDAL